MKSSDSSPRPNKADPARRRRPLLPSLRRVNRLGSAYVQRLMNLKFPTVWSHLSSSQTEMILSMLRPGDVLLKDDCDYPLSQLGARLLGSEWIHAAVYVGNNQIIDCGSKPYVAENNINDFLRASSFAIYRPQFATPEDLESLLVFLRASLGRPFNRTFRFSNKNSFYCTQLIYRALQQMPHPIDLHISDVGGRPAILAGDIELNTELERVYRNRIGLARSIFCHIPSAAACVIGALALRRIRPSFGGAGAAIALVSALAATQYFYYEQLKAKSCTHAN